MLTAVLVGCGAMSARWLAPSRPLTGCGWLGWSTSKSNAREHASRNMASTGRGRGRRPRGNAGGKKPDILFDVVTPEARRGVVLSASESGASSQREADGDADGGAREILAAARQHGRLQAVVQNRRYLAEFGDCAVCLASGALGRTTGVAADFFIGPHFGGFREDMEHVLLLDMAIHTFDVARYLAGSAPKSVSASNGRPPTGQSDRRVGGAAFEFADRSIFTYCGSWCAPGLKTSWESNWRIVCERGSVVCGRRTHAPVAERITGARDGLFDAVEPVEVPALDAHDRVGGHLGVIEDFVRRSRRIGARDAN